MMKALALCLLASPAMAEPVCMPRADLIAKLDAGYSERQTVRAAEARGGVVEIYVSPAGTWTLVVIPPTSGPLQACLIAAGTDFMMIAQGVEG